MNEAEPPVRARQTSPQRCSAAQTRPESPQEEGRDSEPALGSTSGTKQSRSAVEGDFPSGQRVSSNRSSGA